MDNEHPSYSKGDACKLALALDPSPQSRCDPVCTLSLRLDASSDFNQVDSRRWYSHSFFLPQKPPPRLTVTKFRYARPCRLPPFLGSLPNPLAQAQARERIPKDRRVLPPARQPRSICPENDRRSRWQRIRPEGEAFLTRSDDVQHCRPCQPSQQLGDDAGSQIRRREAASGN